MHIGDQMKTILPLVDGDRSLARGDVGGRLTDRDVSAVSMGGGGHAGGRGQGNHHIWGPAPGLVTWGH